MQSIVYEGPGNRTEAVEPKKEPTPEKTFKIGSFEFAKASADPKTSTITVPSLLNTLMTAVASSTDPKIREVLDKAGIQINDLNGKQYFPR